MTRDDEAPDHPRIVHVDRVPLEVVSGTGDAQADRRGLSAAAGADALGCGLIELAPGKKVWPYHFHHGNEEAIYVLEGVGTLRLDGGEYEVGPGTWITLPIGAEGAHEMRNEGEVPLKYLCLSTMREPDIVEYPDSGKVGLFAGTAPGAEASNRTLTTFLDGGATRPYWEPESEA